MFTQGRPAGALVPVLPLDLVRVRKPTLGGVWACLGACAYTTCVCPCICTHRACILCLHTHVACYRVLEIGLDCPSPASRLFHVLISTWAAPLNYKVKKAPFCSSLAVWDVFSYRHPHPAAPWKIRPQKQTKIGLGGIRRKLRIYFLKSPATETLGLYCNQKKFPILWCINLQMKGLYCFKCIVSWMVRKKQL